MQFDEFIRKVAERADVSLETAEMLTAATLRTLAERISGGEAEDLASQLPRGLERHLAEVAGPAEPFGLDEFNRRVAERTALDPDRALMSQGAVFATLREAVAPGELEKVVSQLPDELRGVIGQGG